MRLPESLGAIRKCIKFQIVEIYKKYRAFNRAIPVTKFVYMFCKASKRGQQLKSF